MTTDPRTTANSTGVPVTDHTAIPQYELRVKGHLGPRWASWFDGLSLTRDDDGTTVIRGELVDQAALHGVLQKLRDLGLPLLSLTQIPPAAPTAPTAPPTHEGN